MDAAYTITASGAAVEVSGEALRDGVFRGSVTGVEAGEAQITLRASHPGFHTASDSFGVVVEDLFDLPLWRELVFDGFDCPDGFRPGGACTPFWGERAVEDRFTTVLGFVPNYHIVTAGERTFTPEQVRLARVLIRDTVEQLTGRRFTGRITSGPHPARAFGWMSVFAVANSPARSGQCGAASVGIAQGGAIVNVDLVAEGRCEFDTVLMHEIGHTLGFYHVVRHDDHIMASASNGLAEPVFSQGEQFHGRMAWEFGRGMRYTENPRAAASPMWTEAPVPDGWLADRVDDSHWISCPMAER